MYHPFRKSRRTAALNRLSILALLCAAVGAAQTTVDLRGQSRNVDFSGAQSTRPVKTGLSLPATCSTGELFFKSDAVSGQNLYGCTNANEWTVMTDAATLPTGGAPHQILTVKADGSGLEFRSPGPGLTAINGGFGLDTAVTPLYYTGAGAPAIAGCAAGRDLYTDTVNGEFYWCSAAGVWRKLIRAGGLSGADLPNPAPSSKGGVLSTDCSALGGGYFLQKINTDGSVTCTATAGGGSSVSGPASSVPNHIPQFAGADGKAIKDGLGIVTSVANPGTHESVPTEAAVRAAIAALAFGDFSGPASAASGNLVSFSGALGKTGQDSGIAAANVLQATQAIRQSYTAGAGDVAARSLVRWNADGTVSPASTGDAIVGIAQTSAAASASVMVDQLGLSVCVAEGAIAAGNYIIAGAITPGRCKDSGVANLALAPVGMRIAGRAAAGAADGAMFAVNLFGPDRSGGLTTGSGGFAVTATSNAKAGCAQWNSGNLDGTGVNCGGSGGGSSDKVAAFFANALAAGIPRYSGPGGGQGNTTVENRSQVPWPIAATVKKIALHLDTSAAGVPVTVTLRKCTPSGNGTCTASDTPLTCSVAVGERTCAASTDISISAGDLISVSLLNNAGASGTISNANGTLWWQ